eukprot:Nk52_evm72s270 gene=Nk52_evmTU72s270
MSGYMHQGQLHHQTHQAYGNQPYGTDEGRGTSSKQPGITTGGMNHHSSPSRLDNSVGLTASVGLSGSNSSLNSSFSSSRKAKRRSSISQTFAKPVKVFALCGTWYFFSACTNNLGKSILNKFPHPATLTICQFFCVTAIITIMMDVLKTHKRQYVSRDNWVLLILPLSIGRVFGSVMSQMSIWKVPVSYAHTVKAMSPIFTVILSSLILGTKHTREVYISLAPIVIGVLIATVSEIEFNIIGLVCALSSTLVFGLQNIYSKKHMKDRRFDHLNLLLSTSSLSLALLFPLWFFLDFIPLMMSEEELDPQYDLWWLLPRLIANGLCNSGQSIVAFNVLFLISPVSYSVASSAKRIIIITSSMLTFHNKVTTTNVIGMAIAMGGVFMYNRAKMLAQKKRNDNDIFNRRKSDADLDSSIQDRHIIGNAMKELPTYSKDIRVL